MLGLPLRYHQQLWPRQKTEWDGDADKGGDDDNIGDDDDDDDEDESTPKLTFIPISIAGQTFPPNGKYAFYPEDGNK